MTDDEIWDAINNARNDFSPPPMTPEEKARKDFYLARARERQEAHAARRAWLEFEEKVNHLRADFD